MGSGMRACGRKIMLYKEACTTNTVDTVEDAVHNTNLLLAHEGMTNFYDQK